MAATDVEETSLQVVLQFYSVGWNQKDISVIEKIFAEGYRSEGGISQMVGGINCRDDMIRYMKSVYDAVPDIHFEIEVMYAGGGVVVVEFTSKGTIISEFSEKLTDTGYHEVSGTTVFLVEDGIIQRAMTTQLELGKLRRK